MSDIRISILQSASFVLKWTFARKDLSIIRILLSHKIFSNENYWLSSWNIKSNYWSCSSKMEPNPCTTDIQRTLIKYIHIKHVHFDYDSIKYAD